MPLENK